jgi:hypothetical protein
MIVNNGIAGQLLTGIYEARLQVTPIHCSTVFHPTWLHVVKNRSNINKILTQLPELTGDQGTT